MVVSSYIFSYICRLIKTKDLMVTIDQIKELTERTTALGRYL